MKVDVLARYADLQMPRYTSYPTAPHFAALGADDYRLWLAESRPGSDTSLYLHLPFCRSMCWYCGCHTTVTARDEPIARYVEALADEIDLVAEAIPHKAAVKHVHFGGGTPTLVQPRQFIALMDQLRDRFDIAYDAEIAIEIDPRTLDHAMVDALAVGGVTRASLGVQSFDPVVQHAINRVQSFAQVEIAVSRLRTAGITAINFDLIYGLPHQTVRSCLDTAAQSLELEPDRFAVFGYAHVPTFKLHQRKIQGSALPDGSARHAQAEAIAAALVSANFQRIGLDHYARPTDALAIAAENGALHRNFQGYTTDGSETLLGFGASSIGRLQRGYVQNAVLIGEYQRRIAGGELAVGRGRAFEAEDRLRAVVIERIMCDYRVDLGEVCGRFGTDPDEILASAEGLQALIGDGIVRCKGNVITIEDDARPLVRVVAATFDQYFCEVPARYSRAV